MRGYKHRAYAAQRFAENLTGARRRAGISQEEMGLRSQVHPTWISHLESGRCLPSLETVIKLCRGLEVDPDTLLAGVHEDPEEGED